MLRQFARIALVVLLSSGGIAAAIEVRPGTGDEVLDGLVGCWTMELQPPRRPSPHFVDRRSVCFDADHSVYSLWASGDKYGLEVVDAWGRVSVESEKIVLTVSGGDGWLFKRAVLSCDIILSPGSAFKLLNCTGYSERPWPVEPEGSVADVSFGSISDWRR